MKLDKQNFIRSKAIENQNDPEGQKILWSRHANKKDKICPGCGGLLEDGKATIPFITSRNIVIVVKDVPAEICY